MTDLEQQVSRRPGAAATVDRLGQATAVEQARAVAEVQAAIVVAQQVPRDLIRARAQMVETCGMHALAERAFFRYARAGNQITGPSIHLARELARCFGNVQYGIGELRRDDAHGQSEMMAWAWDVQNNTRASTAFIVPHGMDVTRDGVKMRKDLTDLRDIYENNANMGARRLREQIFAVLPVWFTEEAKALCIATLEKGLDGKPLSVRVEEALERFRAAYKVTEAQLEAKIGRKRGDWTVHDVVALGVVWTSLQNQETTVDAEFPEAPPVTAAEITGQAAARVNEQPAAEERPAAKPSAARQKRMARLHALLKDRGIESDEAVRQAVGEILGKPVDTRTGLTPVDLEKAIGYLEKLDQPPPEGEKS